MALCSGVMGLNFHVVLEFVYSFYDNAVADTEAFCHNIVLSVILGEYFDLGGVHFVVLVHNIDKLLILDFNRTLLLNENRIALIHRGS